MLVGVSLRSDTACSPFVKVERNVTRGCFFAVALPWRVRTALFLLCYRTQELFCLWSCKLFSCVLRRRSPAFRSAPCNRDMSNELVINLLGSAEEPGISYSAAHWRYCVDTRRAMGFVRRPLLLGIRFSRELCTKIRIRTSPEDGLTAFEVAACRTLTWLWIMVWIITKIEVSAAAKTLSLASIISKRLVVDVNATRSVSLYKKNVLFQVFQKGCLMSRKV